MSYAYNELGKLTSQTASGAYELALEYAYDKAGRITSESRRENGETVESRYEYDALGRLTAFTQTGGYAESYSYDAVGNMTVKTAGGETTRMSYNEANQLVRSVSGGAVTDYTYDANGNLISKSGADGESTYTYNGLNLLESYTGEDGYAEQYTYNADRLLETVTKPEGTTEFTWDTLMGEGQLIAASMNGETTRYDYGLERISALSGNTKTEYLYDGMGNVAAELSYNSAWYSLSGLLSKAEAAAKAYTPYGELLTEKISGFGYNAEYYNAETGMVYLRARFYEPEQNRFSQKDIIRGETAVPQSLNRYAYVQNDPVNFCDPSGMMHVQGMNGVGGETYSSSAKAKAAAAAASAAALGVAFGTQSGLATATASTTANSYNPQREYYEQRRAATTPTMAEYNSLRQQGLSMSYGQYANMKQQTKFPDYTEYMYNKAHGRVTYQTYGPLQAATGQYSTTYPRSPGYIPGMPTIERVSIESGDCSEPPNVIGLSEEEIARKVQEAVDENFWLKLLAGSSLGVSGGFGLTGQAGVSFAIDEAGNIYAVIDVGAGGGLGVSGKGKNSQIGVPGASGGLFNSVELVPSKDYLEGWGSSIGATITWFNVSFSTVGNDNESFNGGFNGFGLEFHANITHSWAIKIGEVDY